MGSAHIPFLTNKNKIPNLNNKILLDGAAKEIKYDKEKDIFISSRFNFKECSDISPSLKLTKFKYLKSKFLSYYPPSKSYNETLFKMGYKDAEKLLQNPKFIRLI